MKSCSRYIPLDRISPIKSRGMDMRYRLIGACFDGQDFVGLCQSSQIDQDREKNRQRKHPINDLGQKINEVIDHDVRPDVVLNDIGQELEQASR